MVRFQNWNNLLAFDLQFFVWGGAQSPMCSLPDPISPAPLPFGACSSASVLAPSVLDLPPLYLIPFDPPLKRYTLMQAEAAVARWRQNLAWCRPHCVEM